MSKSKNDLIKEAKDLLHDVFKPNELPLLGGDGMFYYKNNSGVSHYEVLKMLNISCNRAHRALCLLDVALNTEEESHV